MPVPTARFPHSILALGAALVLSCVVAVPTAGSHSEAGAAASDHPAVQAVYVGAPPVINGHLDDDCWSRAARLEGFCCIDVDEPAPEETEALICLDDRAIYVAVICHDRSPDDIVASETRRNGDIWKDDFVWLALDPWHQHGECYFFNVTARGTQSETIPGGSATKIEWRGDWRGAAVRTPTGWQAEMAIPFGILRYPPGQTTFGFNVGRRFAGERISTRYPAEMGIAADPNRAADLVGLHPPASARRPLMMPYLTLDTGESVGRRTEAGLDVQCTLRNGLTALAVVNPDFKQIEDVVEPISFSYTERYLPDPRPFFITGQEGYFPPSDLLYTRRIEEFDAGLKLFGTLGSDTIGILDAVTVDDENAVAASWRHRFSDAMTAKASLVSHREEGRGANSCYGLDADYAWRTPEGFDGVWVGLYQSQAQGGEDGGSYTVGGSHYRGVGRLRYNWQLQVVTEEFNPTLGYFPDTDYVGGESSFGKWDHFETGAIEGRGWLVNTYYYPYLRGDGIFRCGVAPSYSWSWRDGRSFDLGFSRSRRDSQDSSDVYTSYGWNTRDMY
ncbi:MAG: carbohydrate binding family 9 domain-containing protein, partial [Armatimonadota bacterium]